MTTTAVRARSTWNGAQIGLLVTGLLALVVGGIVALVGKANGDQAALVDSYTNTLLSQQSGFDTAGGAYGAMWAGVVIAGLGLVLLIAVVIVRAARA